MERATYTVKEMAKILGIGVNKAYDLVNQKRIPAIKIGKQIKVPVKALDAWLEAEAAKGM